MRIKIANPRTPNDSQYTSSSRASQYISSGVARMRLDGQLEFIAMRRIRNGDAPSKRATLKQIAGLPVAGGEHGAVKLLSLITRFDPQRPGSKEKYAAAVLRRNESIDRLIIANRTHREAEKIAAETARLGLRTRANVLA